MSIEIKLSPETGALGPASLLIATSSIVDPGPLPWSWIWDFIETVDNRQILSVTTTSLTAVPGGYRYLYNQDLVTPSELATQFTIKDGTPVRVNVRLLIDTGAQVDTGTITIPWQASIQQHFDMMQIVKSFSGTGGFAPSDRELLEHIDSAVWKPWPNG